LFDYVNRQKNYKADRRSAAKLSLNQSRGAPAFSRDGKTLAGGSDDSTVRLWDVAAHQQIGAPLTSLSSSVFSVVFSPDGNTLAIGSADGTVRLRDVGYLTGIVQYLCASVGRSLTQDEWARYVPPGTAYQRVCP
jgi:WD40 repeat protein